MKTFAVVCVGVSILPGLAPLSAATPVSGLINNPTWVKGQSPYVVVGDVLVNALTIQPGVSILFESNFVFEVAGRLTAVGTEAEPILFSRTTNSSVGWRGIFFNENPLPSEIAFCRIERSSGDGIRILNSRPVIRDCVIAQNASVGIRNVYLGPERFVLARCVITDNNGSGLQLQVNEAALEGCTLLRNGNGVGFYGQGTLECVRCDFKHHNAGGSYGGAIYVHSAPAKLIMKNCLLTGNKAKRGGGIYCQSGASLVNLLITDNSSNEGSGGGLCQEGCSQAVNMTNCTVAFNTNGGLSFSCTARIENTGIP